MACYPAGSCHVVFPRRHKWSYLLNACNSCVYWILYGILFCRGDHISIAEGEQTYP